MSRGPGPSTGQTLEHLVPADHRYSGVTIVLPVVNETDSLDRTAAILKETSDAEIAEVLVVVCERTTPASLDRCRALEATFDGRVTIHNQTLPFLGGAMREAFDMASAGHVVMMSSDLETDPRVVPTLIERAKRSPRSIVTASRWADGGGFSGYGTLRVGINWLFQRLISVLYRTHLTDATYAYRLFPTPLVQSIRWEGMRHEFLLETILKPLRLGVEVSEVAAVWHQRTEGQSQNSLGTQARYIGTVLVNRFRPPSTMLRPVAERVEA